MTIYEMLPLQGTLKNTFLLTALDGEAAGQHALMRDGAIFFREEGFPGSVSPDCARTGICRLPGGEEVFADRLSKTPTLVICGGGHVAGCVLRQALRIGLRTCVIEDRSEFAEAAARAGADRVLTGAYGEMLSRLREEEDSFYLVMTRGHLFDMECLAHILRRHPPYCGMMSSRGRAENARRELLAQGIREEELQCLHAPVGLPIGAETPEEIAVSVIAEVISVMKSRGSAGMRSELICALSGGPERMLVQIIAKSGSAPRGAGTKMLVYADGRTTGTVGGGQVEGMFIKKAVSMLEDGTKHARMRIDLAGAGRGEPGEVYCGGKLEVFLEYLPASGSQ